MYSAQILQDSINPVGVRLTTWELTYPRFVHAELLTHRMFSRNSASSRAIPVRKLIERVRQDPVIPIYWGEAQAGMQAGTALPVEQERVAVQTWLETRDYCIRQAQKLIGEDWWYHPDLGWFTEGERDPHTHQISTALPSGRIYLGEEHLRERFQLKLHKQLVNRLLEPWMWITVILSATDYGNFFNLRNHPDAQPEIREVARLMVQEYFQHQPTPLKEGEWHLPLLFPEDAQFPLELKKALSTARCARVSYLTHQGKRDPTADFELYERLKSSRHMSPFEHPAVALSDQHYYGNFRGFYQHRKEIVGENQEHYEVPGT